MENLFETDDLGLDGVALENKKLKESTTTFSEEDYGTDAGDQSEKVVRARKHSQNKLWAYLLGFPILTFFLSSLIASGFSKVGWTSLPTWLANLSPAAFSFTIGGIVAGVAFAFGAIYLASEWLHTKRLPMTWVPWTALFIFFIVGVLTFIPASAGLLALWGLTPTALSLSIASIASASLIALAFGVRALMVLIPKFGDYIEKLFGMPITLVDRFLFNDNDNGSFFKDVLKMLIGYGVFFAVVALITFYTGGAGLPLTPELAALAPAELSLAIAGIFTGSFLGALALGVTIVKVSERVSGAKAAAKAKREGGDFTLKLEEESGSGNTNNNNSNSSTSTSSSVVTDATSQGLEERQHLLAKKKEGEKKEEGDDNNNNNNPEVGNEFS